MSKKPCNVALGRFQPFTKGHLQMLKDGYDKNGYPAVVFMIANKKFDSKHPFSDELIAKEMEIVKKKYKFVADTVPATNADIVKIGQKLAEMGYEAHLWLCGDDREAQFKRQAENPKYREQGQFPDDFTTYTGTGRTEGVSGTAVRNALKADNKKEFKKLVPDGVDVLFDDLKKEIDAVKESMKNLVEYIKIYEAKHHVDQTTVGDFYKWYIDSEMPDGKHDKPEATKEGAQHIIDNSIPGMLDTAKEVAELFNNHWNDNIKVTSRDTDEMWEIDLQVGKQKITVMAQTAYGDIADE